MRVLPSSNSPDSQMSGLFLRRDVPHKGLRLSRRYTAIQRVGAFYGMRRSEALGMKWDAIDFEQNPITIGHTLTSVELDGKKVTVL